LPTSRSPAPIDRRSKLIMILQRARRAARSANKE
jgi:hypothetical protein